MSEFELDLTAAIDAAAVAILDTADFGPYFAGDEHRAAAVAAIQAVLPHLVGQIGVGISVEIKTKAKEIREFGARVGWEWTNLNTAKDAGYMEAANIAECFGEVR